VINKIALNSRFHEAIEKERMFGLSFFLNYIFKIPQIADSIAFKKFLSDAYFDEQYFTNSETYYSFPVYETHTMKESMYNYFSGFFKKKDELVVQSKDEIEILFLENNLKIRLSQMEKTLGSFNTFENLLRLSDQNCKEFITAFMLLKDINCFKKKEQLEIQHFSVKMQNLKSLYYFNIENFLQKQNIKIKEVIYLIKGALIQIEDLKEFLTAIRKFHMFMTVQKGEKFKKEYEELTSKKEKFLVNLRKELDDFVVKHSDCI